jgi:transcriptional regulator with XRE-family HTH domain
MTKNKSKPISARQLAKAAGVHPSTVSRYLKANPDAPRHSERDFVKAFNEARMKAGNDPQQDALATRFNRAKVEKMENDAALSGKRLALLEQDYLKKSDAVELVGKLSAEIAGIIRFRMTRELPPQLEGLRPPEIRAKIERLLDKSFDEHRTNTLEKFDALERDTKLSSAISARSKGRKSKPIKRKA